MQNATTLHIDEQEPSPIARDSQMSHLADVTNSHRNEILSAYYNTSFNTGENFNTGESFNLTKVDIDQLKVFYSNVDSLTKEKKVELEFLLKIMIFTLWV